MRICSFLPSSTELAYALGLGDSLAGVTCECDYPPEARQKPVVVHSKLRHGLSAREIDREVNDFAARGESLYRLDIEKLRAIQPDLIITQDLCHVCAASPADLGALLPQLSPAPRVLSLRPRRLADVWQDILTVGEATGRLTKAKALVQEIEERVERVKSLAEKESSRPRVACLEWVDPPFVAGHWVPEMVEIAGGQDLLGKAGEPSYRATWDQILASRPEIIIFMPCGYSATQAAREAEAMAPPPGWLDVPAVRNGHLYAVDATSYFSRPGPRLVEGLEILLNLIHGVSEVHVPANSVTKLSVSAAA